MRYELTLKAPHTYSIGLVVGFLSELLNYWNLKQNFIYSQKWTKYIQQSEQNSDAKFSTKIAKSLAKSIHVKSSFL